jgi:hypothetical protein
MMNSLDVDPEWGAIDLLEEVEETFGIKVADAEAERCETVGDLYAIVRAHAPDWDTQAGNCASSMAFYRLRRSLEPGNGPKTKPRSPLLDGSASASRLFKTLDRDTGLRLPSTEFTRPGKIGAYLFTIGLLGFVITLFIGAWTASGVAAFLAILGTLLMRQDPGKLPNGVVTVGDLARRAAALNSGKLKGDGGRPADCWTVLVALAAEHGVLPPDEIGPDTFFHRKSLELASR